MTAGSTDVRFVVIGAGVMGSATAWALARDGHEVLLLERFEVGHAHGSSHGTSRIFRLSYPDPAFVRMALEARPMWGELEEETGEHLLTVTGGLDLGPASERNADAMTACDVPFERLDAAEVSARYPTVSPPPGGTAIFQPDAGFVAADRAVRGFVDAAVARGAELRERTRAVALSTGDDGAVVRTEDGDIRAEVAVVTAGAWASDLLSGVRMELPVTVTRETVGYFALHGEPPLPAVVEWTEPAGYALPAPGVGLKAGLHHGGRPAHPDHPGGPDGAVVERVEGWVRERFPAAADGHRAAETCLYTTTSDERFILERRGPIVVGSPCSGHGFKFAPLIGRRLAGMALGLG